MSLLPAADTSNQMFGPLTLENSSKPPNEAAANEISCILCSNTFNLILGFDIFVKHLFQVHQLVIEEIQNIENLPEYIEYWRAKFQTIPIEEIVPTIKVDPTNHQYFVLSTLIQQDKELRHKLRLDHTLKVQQFERSDSNYTRQCLFCRLTFEKTTRATFLHHLAQQHNLQLGNPDNLVFIDQLIEQINAKLEKLECIFCQRTFPERNILKEHMRKKLHKRINRHNKEYDRFYIVNYLEIDRKWKSIQREDDEDNQVDSDNEYSDWNEQQDLITCLFCAKKEADINTLCLHMDADHEFDFAENTKTLDFYQKIKFVNYVRRQTHREICFFCDVKCDDLERHYIEAGHLKMPEMKKFDQPEFYFPTYENDTFLYFIDDVED